MRVELDDALADAVLLCGGRGSRLQEVRGEVVKPLVQVGGRPLIQYLLDQLDPSAINRLIFAVDYDADQIQQWVRSTGIAAERNVVFSHQTQPGIVHAFMSALNHLTRDTLATCNTDEIAFGFQFSQLLEFHRRSQTAATVAAVVSNHLFRHRVLTIRKGDNLVIKTDVRNEEYREKPWQTGLVNAWMVIMNERAADYIDPQHSPDWNGIIDPLVYAGQLSAFIMAGVTYFNVNTPDVFAEAQNYVRSTQHVQEMPANLSPTHAF